eukprot:scaffold22864_cov37-Phaeocystis_antarctica.AAC.2
MSLGPIIGLGSICQPFPAGPLTRGSASPDPWIQGLGAQVLSSRSKLTPFPHMVLGASRAMRVSLERLLGTCAPKPWIHGSGLADPRVNGPSLVTTTQGDQTCRERLADASETYN